MKKFLITVVIILLIGALGFAIYAAINHSTSSNHNNEQDNKATHQKKDTEVNHQKDENTNNTNENQNNRSGDSINGNQSSTPSTVQNNGSTAPANTQPSNPNQSNSNQSDPDQSNSNHGGSRSFQRITKIINNRTHHLLINQIIPIRLLNKRLKYDHLKINHLPDTSTSIRYINSEKQQ